jgi:hypothetical protein
MLVNVRWSEDCPASACHPTQRMSASLMGHLGQALPTCRCTRKLLAQRLPVTAGHWSGMIFWDRGLADPSAGGSPAGSDRASVSRLLDDARVADPVRIVRERLAIRPLKLFVQGAGKSSNRVGSEQFRPLPIAGVDKLAATRRSGGFDRRQALFADAVQRCPPSGFDFFTGRNPKLISRPSSARRCES